MTTIKDFPNYLIYSDGKCWSTNRNRFLIPCKHSAGYKVYNLYNNGKRKSYLIHRLIGEYFIPNPNNLPYIDHINRNRADYRIENLKWVSSQENANNTNVKKSSTTGHKNIYEVVLKGSKYYRFKKKYKGKEYTKVNKSLDYIIEYRNKWYNDNLPDYCSCGLDI